MSVFAVVLLIAYVQCGLLLAWYLFCRRVLALRQDFGAQLAAREASLRDLVSEVSALRRQVRELAASNARRPLSREAQILQQAKHRGVWEMARRGMNAKYIAETLNMRRAEVELLLRLEQLQRDAHSQAACTTPKWLETAS
jgi:site-specific recombinase XerC